MEYEAPVDVVRTGVKSEPALKSHQQGEPQRRRQQKQRRRRWQQQQQQQQQSVLMKQYRHEHPQAGFSLQGGGRSLCPLKCATFGC